MEILNDFARYTVFAIWVLGGIVAILLLVYLVLQLGWVIYRAIYGWPAIFKAMSLYQEQRRAERHARNVEAIRAVKPQKKP